MKKYILAVVILTALFSCDTKEKAILQKKVDSLSVQLTMSREVEKSLDEVGILIDSIDASRNSLQLKMIEGNNYADYVSRLNEINGYVKQTENKLDVLEKSSKNNSKTSSSTIRRMKADLEIRTTEIVELQMQVTKLRDENMAVWVKVNEKDSILAMKDQIIKLSQSDIVSLENLINVAQAENKNTVANLYFAQAEALEEAADRTQFAPRKKKEARLEALELYKLSLSLGNIEAQLKITDLERKLS